MISTTSNDPSATTQAVAVTGRPHFVSIPNLERSIAMNVMYEDLARAHMDARLERAREARQSAQLVRAQRRSGRVERASQQARRLLDRTL